MQQRADPSNILEMTVWSEISKLLWDPQRVELEPEDGNENGALSDNLGNPKIPKSEARACGGEIDRQLCQRSD